MTFSISELLNTRRGDNFSLHEQHLNNQMVRVLKTIGYDRVYTKAQGQYLYDDQGQEYLDLLSGFGVFALGRNHPTVKSALREVLEADLPDLVQMDVSLLSGLLAEKLVEVTPEPLTRLFFCNSGAEAVEAAIKFARYTTGRSRILHCEHAFHGLTLGALSLNGEAIFRQGFGPLLPDCHAIPFNDLEALEQALQEKETAAFIVEPIQGKGVNLPDDHYLAEAARLCHRYGALFVADEIQTGLGRTGKLWAIDHWQVEPDMLLMAKALSGGFIPVGAVAMTSKIMDKVFNRMDRAVVHGSTFSKNNMAMAAGLATLTVIEEENLTENAARQGEALTEGLNQLVEKYEFFQEVRGKGLMLAMEFGKPKSLKLKTAWNLLETANKGLFSQMITIPLFKRHRILSQVAGHGMNVVKFLPPLIITDKDTRWIVSAMDEVLADCHQIPGAIWDLGKTLAGHAIKAKKSA
ncbi:MAG: aminotransferase [Methylothermaceae bacteria B42]|nr:MAG: aminotransferase [Methylothermaceae bacteria B42]HHJ38215.1 aspartate aminotransferase family protein [Methylothermaceae bacterium]